MGEKIHHLLELEVDVEQWALEYGIEADPERVRTDLVNFLVGFLGQPLVGGPLITVWAHRPVGSLTPEELRQAVNTVSALPFSGAASTWLMKDYPSVLQAFTTTVRAAAASYERAEAERVRLAQIERDVEGLRRLLGIPEPVLSGEEA